MSYKHFKGGFNSRVRYVIKGNVDQEVIDAIEKSWCEETGGIFFPDNPSKYQCAVTALLIQDLYGGRLVRGTTPTGSHYWNELPDGTIVDLTRQQFGDKVHELVVDGYRDREYVQHAGADTNERYQVLKSRFEANLAERQ